MILGKILVEEIHNTSGKILAGDDRDVMERPLLRARQDPCREYWQDRGKAFPPHRRPSSATDPPTKQVPTWQYVAPKPTS